MRKCMKGFNFKMNIDEIDRIIEEDDSMAQEDNQNSDSKKAAEEYKKEMNIDIKPDLIANEAQKIKRKGWG